MTKIQIRGINNPTTPATEEETVPFLKGLLILSSSQKNPRWYGLPTVLNKAIVIPNKHKHMKLNTIAFIGEFTPDTLIFNPFTTSTAKSQVNYFIFSFARPLYSRACAIAYCHYCAKTVCTWDWKQVAFTSHRTFEILSFKSYSFVTFYIQMS